MRCGVNAGWESRNACQRSSGDWRSARWSIERKTGSRLSFDGVRGWGDGGGGGGIGTDGSVLCGKWQGIDRENGGDVSAAGKEYVRNMEHGA